MRFKLWKGLLVFLILGALLGSYGCESKRTLPDGKVYSCVGVADREDEGLPNIRYKASVRNIVLRALFSELILIPPIIVLANEFWCPVGYKTNVTGN